MITGKMKSVLIIGLILIICLHTQAVSAKTWRLDGTEGLKQVSNTGQDQLLLAVAELKQLVNLGQTKAAKKGFKKLKTDFPQIQGPDMDAFINAEILLSDGKFTKAARAYEKFLLDFPESKLYQAVLDRQYAIAKAFLAGKKRPILKIFKIKGYAEGSKMMEKISDRTGDAPISLQAAKSIAKSFEDRNKWQDAYSQWSVISSRWPTGQTGKEALLAMARCKHAAYRGPNYDTSNLVSAKSYYQRFQLHYPEDAEKFEIAKRIHQIDEQLAHKKFETGRYYQKAGNEQSANFYYQMVIENWPNSTAAKMAKAAMKDKTLVGIKEKGWKRKLVTKIEKLVL